MTVGTRIRGPLTSLWSAGWRLSRRYAPRTRAVAMAVIVGLLVAVTVLRWFVDGAGQAAALLYVVPISLSALRFGRRGGLIAAGVSVAAFTVLELVHARGDVDVTGWVAPIVAMALMGGLVGNLSESVARTEAARRDQEQRLEELRRAQIVAAEASDSIVQRVAAARWMLEVGMSQQALAALDATVADGIDQGSSALPPLTLRPSEGGSA
jgi:K+-sensing histidine kinase KdpD